MGLIGDFLDWTAEKVQKVTGEEERRDLVARLKKSCIEFKKEVEVLVSLLNDSISIFNKKVIELNELRKGPISKNADNLSLFLNKFGELKEVEEYLNEESKDVSKIPCKQFDRAENYISSIDWSKDDVFLSTFFLSPIGMKIKTRKQNVSIREHINEFKMESCRTINELKQRTFLVDKDKEICEIYIECVRYISTYIDSVIIPEFELVEAFFQAKKIKDEIIVNKVLENIAFKNNINTLNNSVYIKHYLFVKNTFMFYILACRIYNTQILTRLIANETKADDINIIEKYREALFTQSKHVSENSIINGEII